MTIFQYLKTLPQSDFELVLLAMMDIPCSAEAKENIHEIMEQQCNGFTPWVDQPTQANDESILGYTASTLPQEQQEKLKNALKDYCEVCDYMNQRLADQQSQK